MTQEREITVYNLVLGTCADGGVVILEKIFRYGASFTGATGSVVRPISEDEIKQAMQEKVEYLRETCNDVGARGVQRQKIMRMPRAEYLEYRFETYGDVSRPEIAIALGVEPPERYTYDSTGRVFPRALENIQLIDSEEVRMAVKAIHAAERGESL